MVGLSTIGNISLAKALVAGKKRVPSPAAGMIAFLTILHENSLDFYFYPIHFQSAIHWTSY